MFNKLFIASSLLLGAFSASADVVVLNPTDAGWYADTGTHIISNPNFITSVQTDALGDVKIERRSFFQFDTSGLPQTGQRLVGAWFEVDQGTSGSSLGG